MATMEAIMRPDELLTWVRTVPFVPFRIRMNSGRTFDIRHPEMLRVGRSIIHVFFVEGDPSAPYERFEMLGLLLIENVAPIDSGRPA